MSKRRRKPKERDEEDHLDLAHMGLAKPDNDNDFTVPTRRDLVKTQLPLYLPEELQGTNPVIVAVVPPDLMQCQCEWRDTTFDTFGPKPILRCREEPSVVAFQKRDPHDDTITGAISLCDDHMVMLEHMYPGQLYFRRISSEKKIGDFV